MSNEKDVIELLDDTDDDDENENHPQARTTATMPGITATATTTTTMTRLKKQEPTSNRGNIPPRHFTNITRLQKYPNNAKTGSNSNATSPAQQQSENNSGSTDTSRGTSPTPDTATFQHALFVTNKDTRQHNTNTGISNLTEQPTQQQQQEQELLQDENNNSGAKVPCVDPIYQNDAYLNSIEMEILMLAEECLYCWNDKRVEIDFLWQYATPHLRILLRKIQPQQDNNSVNNDSSSSTSSTTCSLIRQLLQDRWKDALVRARFDFLRQSYRQKLRQGFRRPLMAPVIANTRLFMIRGKRPNEFPKPYITALEEEAQEQQQQQRQQQQQQESTYKKPKLGHPLARIAVESPPWPAERKPMNR